MNDQLFFMDDSYINEAGTAAFITKDNREIEKNTSITSELLIKNGFKKKYDEILQEYIWDIFVPLKTDPNTMYHLVIKNYSNTPNRNWYIHVDNEVCSSCGSLDIETIYHFNKFIRLLDIDFKIEI